MRYFISLFFLLIVARGTSDAQHHNKLDFHTQEALAVLGDLKNTLRKFIEHPEVQVWEHLSLQKSEVSHHFRVIDSLRAEKLISEEDFEKTAELISVYKSEVNSLWNEAEFERLKLEKRRVVSIPGFPVSFEVSESREVKQGLPSEDVTTLIVSAPDNDFVIELTASDFFDESQDLNARLGAARRVLESQGIMKINEEATLNLSGHETRLLKLSFTKEQIDQMAMKGRDASNFEVYQYYPQVEGFTFFVKIYFPKGSSEGRKEADFFLENLEIGKR